MRFPDLTDPIAALFKLGCYSGARVRADPEVAKLAPLIRVPHKTLKEAVSLRNDAVDLVTDAEAVRDYHLDLLGDHILDLGRTSHAHYKSRTHEGYTRLFAIAPSAIAATPAKDRTTVMTAFLVKVTAAKTPRELQPLGMLIAEQWQEVQTSEAEVTDAQQGLADANEAVVSAHEGWLVGYRRLHAQLTDRFPADKKRVGRYFKSAAPAGAKGKKPEGQEEQGGKKPKGGKGEKKGQSAKGTMEEEKAEETPGE